jgi:serine phosphatase RsbU (regulator of sigma subunit)
MNVPSLSYIDADGSHSVVLDRASTSIGRSPGQDVVLRDAFVSRRHAVIVREGTAYTLIDQESSHGTFLNAERVQRIALKPGDVIQLGSLQGPRLRFQLHPSSEERDSASQSAVIQLLKSFSGFASPDGDHLPATRELERLNWLLSAARELNAGGAITDILTTLLQLTLQLTGTERGFVFLSEGGEMRLARGLNAQGEIIEEDSTVSRRAMHKAIESKLKFSVSDTQADESVAEWPSVLMNRIRSIYCIPLRNRVSVTDASQLLGLLYLDSQIGPGRLTEVDHQLLDTIATEAAALVQNALLGEAEQKARQAREELAVAARIHSGLMSIALPVIPYASIEARAVPCLAIGGDFYDAVALDDCVCVTIADVSGKGVPAAIVAATLQGIIHTQLLAGQSLPEIAALANQFLCTRNVGKYATMVMLRLFPDGRVEYLNCGHIPPLSILGAQVRRLEQSEMIVGLIEGANYTAAHDLLRPGERLLLVTDGVTEAENSTGEAFSDSELNSVARYRDIEEILENVAQFCAPNPAKDDRTLVEIRYSGASHSPCTRVE